ncbi:arylesterase [Undibacterium arcticum]
MRRNLLLIAFALLATNAYSASKKTVLVLGDSLSAEYGLARGAGWVALLERRLKVQNIDAVVVNASISGETTSGGKARLPALLDKFHPALVVIELGGNDGLRGLPLSASEANLRAMISAAQHAKAKKYYWSACKFRPITAATTRKKFAALYGKLARDAKAPLVPFLLKDVADQPQLFQADRIHPTAAAHPIMLDNVWPQLQPLLK